jgi:hypothetical protein
MIVKIVKLAREKRECLKDLLEFSLDSFALIEGLSPLPDTLVIVPLT